MTLLLKYKGLSKDNDIIDINRLLKATKCIKFSRLQILTEINSPQDLFLHEKFKISLTLVNRAEPVQPVIPAWQKRLLRDVIQSYLNERNGNVRQVAITQW